MKAERLKTENLYNPMGIDVVSPTFSWNRKDGIKQTAYRIVASIDNETAWDSGKVKSGDNFAVWKAEALKSRASVKWRVWLWDENDNAEESETAVFEIGLTEKSDWSANWISGNYRPRKKKRYPVDCFKKVFNAGDKIVKARLYITAHGLYEAEINGERAGDAMFTPGFTDYSKRVQYQTYDVTSAVKSGENEINVLLADGWYRGSVGAMGIRNVYGVRTSFCAQLELCYEGGRTERVVTDESWNWSNDGAIEFADMKDGETVDMRKTPSYIGKTVKIKVNTTPTASDNVCVREKERFKPARVFEAGGKTIIDFAQNIAGYVSVYAKAESGGTMRLQFAERLTPDNAVDMCSIQCRPGKPAATPKQELNLTFAQGVNRYKTKFAVFGFRYVSVETDLDISDYEITAIAVYSDMERTGWFSCSNELVNKFFENTLWSMKGNFLDVPTDCPTRERAPWTGDVQIFAKTGSYLMDTAAFLKKWLKDLKDRQNKNGKVPCHAPDVKNNAYFLGLDFIKRMDGCCGWADASVLVPWALYNIFFDKSVLSDCYDMMKAHMIFQISRTNKTGLCGKSFSSPDKKYISNVGQAFGEWLEPKDVYQQNVIQDFIAPHPEEATAYLAYVSSVMCEIADILGKKEDAVLYEEYKNGCKKAYQNQFTPEYTDRQSKLVRPLAFGLLSDEDKSRVLDMLIKAIEKREYKIGTGFLSTPLILPALSQTGRSDLAYKMLENEKEPGWLYEVKQGATTVWETWDGNASQNHYSPGSVCQWLVENACGIKVVGKDRFVIAPEPGGSLTLAQFEFLSPFGRISSRWEKTEKKIVFEVSIPVSCNAELYLPNGVKKELGAGEYVFETARNN